MSYINAYVRCLFGRTTGADQTARSLSGSTAQRVKEQMTVTTYRTMKGPQRNGHYSYHAQVGAGAGGPAGALTVWYSNLPEPDPTSDADWVQDTSIASLNLGAASTTFLNVGNVNAEHVRFKATVTAGTVELNLWARVEGVEV